MLKSFISLPPPKEFPPPSKDKKRHSVSKLFKGNLKPKRNYL
jgi:hypothetical protein